MSRISKLALTVAVATAAGWTGYWYYAAGALEHGVAAWAAERRAEGMSAAFGGIEVMGFPLRWDARVRDPLLAGRSAPAAGAAGGPAWEWRGSEMVAAFRPWNRRRIDLRFPGTHQITLPFDGRAVTVFASAEWAAGTLELGGAGTRARADFEARSLALVAEEGGASLAIERGVFTGLTHPPGEPAYRSATVELAFAGEGLELPPESEPPLGRRIAALEAEASVLGVWPGGPLRASAAGWRDDGGTVEVHRFYVNWGPLRIEAGGTLALDGDLQPMGALTATIRGFAETIDALVAARAVRPADGAAAKIVLALLAKEPKGGGEPEITVPVTAQNGRLYVGSVALLRIPAIRWG
jgi:hypothetical protein